MCHDDEGETPLSPEPFQKNDYLVTLHFARVIDRSNNSTIDRLLRPSPDTRSTEVVSSTGWRRWCVSARELLRAHRCFMRTDFGPWDPPSEPSNFSNVRSPDALGACCEVVGNRDQFLGLLISDLWLTLSSHPLDRDSRERLRQPIGAGWSSTVEDLAAAEEALTGLAAIISLIRPNTTLDNEPPSTGRSASERSNRNGTHGAIPIERILNRVSQALQRSKSILCVVEPRDLDLKCTLEEGTVTLGEMIEHALARAENHVYAASISARRVTQRRSGRGRQERAA